MTTNARLYVIVVLLLGAIVLALSFLQWQLDDPFRFACYFLLAVSASIVKVTMPGLAGKMPFNFLFLLIGIVQLSMPETLLLGCAAVIIECLWRRESRMSLLEILFSLATVSVAISCADYVYTSPYLTVPKPLLIFLATTAFFIANTFPMAAVVALTENRPVLRVWRSEHFETFPFFVTGAAVTWAFDLATRFGGWQSALLILPVLFLLYRTYRLYVARIEDEKIHAEELAALHLRTIEALALAIDAKDDTTHDHLKRVQVYAIEVGKDLGLNEGELEALRAAAVLHDIGKLAVPEHIISKPGKLTPEEFEKMKVHPVVGAEILEHVRFPYPVVPIVQAHHEKWNGTGYPYGLRGKDIPVGARILAAVDALDALASDRQYRRALPLDEAMAKVENEAGKSFDPAVVKVLKKRYVEMEKMAQASSFTSVKLSTNLKIERGAAPAAGFAQARSNQVQLTETDAVPEDVIKNIAKAREDLCEIFETISGEHVSRLNELLAIFTLRLRRIIPFDAIALYFIQEDQLVPEYVFGDNFRLFSSLRIPVGQGLSGWVAENQKSILNGNPSVEPGYLNNPDIFSTLRSALAVPLIGSSRVLGVLTLYHEGRDAFSQDHLRLLQSLAARLALSVENAFSSPAHEPEALPEPTAEGAGLLRTVESELVRAKRLGTSVAIVVCSLQGWSELRSRTPQTDTDRILRALTMTLRDQCREFDTMGKLGESEFLMVMPGMAQSALDAKVAKVRQIAVDATGTNAHVQVQAGGAIFPDDGTELEALLGAADRRLFESRLTAQTARNATASGASGWVQ